MIRERLASQLLAGPRAVSAAAVVDRLLAIQAQDARGFRLAIRSRTDGLTVDDVERSLANRALVVSWLNRGTLHLVAAADFWWMQDLLAGRQRSANARRLRQEGVDAAQGARALDVVAAAVAADGPLTRADLRVRLHDAGVPTAGQALVHVLVAATIAGALLRGPMVGGEQAFVSPEAWLGPRPAVLDREEALVRLAARYVAGHGPAAPEDLAAWAGIPLGDARRAFVDLDAAPEHGRVPGPRPRLLGPFDPVLHGWASREPVAGRHTGIVTTNGVFRPIALVGGRAVATWGLAGGDVTIRPLEPITAAHRRALMLDAADVLRFLRLPESVTTFVE